MTRIALLALLASVQFPPAGAAPAAAPPAAAAAGPCGIAADVCSPNPCRMIAQRDGEGVVEEGRCAPTGSGHTCTFGKPPEHNGDEGLRAPLIQFHLCPKLATEDGATTLSPTSPLGDIYERQSEGTVVQSCSYACAS